MYQVSLKAARVNAGLTVKEAAEKCQVSAQAIINWEKGRYVPNLATTKFLADLYQVPLDNLILPQKSTDNT